MKVAFLIIGTNNYIDLAKSCAKSIHKYVKVDGRLDTIIFTNNPESGPDLNIELFTAHLPWPLITLLRYQTFYEYRDLLSEYDYLMYIDSDMSICENIDFESEMMGELIATDHPGYFNSHPHSWPWEPNQKSEAFIDPNTVVERIKKGEWEQVKYKFGALQGGSSKRFLDACKVMRNRINKDLSNNYIPIWHDETVFNKYCWENQPDKILSPEYAFPEGWNLPFKPKILALKKNHIEIRKED